MKTICKQIGMILLASGFLALMANTVHPHRIPWVQDWSSHLEGRAKEENISVLPFSGALDRHAVGESIFIDARSEEEFGKGHIPSATSIPLELLEDRFDTIVALLESGKELVVYCSSRTCDDALLLAKELKAMGAENLMLYIDGFDFWKEHGGEVEP